VDELDEHAQSRHAEDLDPVDERRLRRVLGGHEQALVPGSVHAGSDGHRAAHRAKGAAERKLSPHSRRYEPLARDLAARAQERDRER
jgi:hypothetical protein